MKTLFKDRYQQDKLIIGMVHTLALPGAPLYDRAGGMRKVIAQAKKEARILWITATIRSCTAMNPTCPTSR